MKDSNTGSDDSWLTRYIRVLEMESPYGEWAELEASLDVEAADDLKEAGYIHGTIISNSNGTPVRASIQRTTLEGKLFLEDQKRIIHERTFSGKMRKRFDLLLGWFLGLISSLLILYISNNLS